MAGVIELLMGIFVFVFFCSGFLSGIAMVWLTTWSIWTILGLAVMFGIALATVVTYYLS